MSYGNENTSKIANKLEHILKQVEEENRFQENGLLPINRMIIFLFIEQNSSEQKPSEYAQECIQHLKRLSHNLVRNNGVYFDYYACDFEEGSMPKEVQQNRDAAAREHAINNLTAVLICPIFLCGQFSNINCVSKIAQEFISIQQRAKREWGFQPYWQPFAFLESDSNGIRASQKACVQSIQKCMLEIQAIGKMQSIESCSRICLITDYDQNGHALSVESRIQTVLWVAVIQYIDSNGSLNSSQIFTPGVDDTGIFTARAVVITEPIQSIILKRLEQTLQWYYSAGNNNDKVIKTLGRLLGQAAKEQFQNIVKDKFPMVGESISTEPLWSVIFTNDKVQDKRRLEQFKDRYYRPPWDSTMEILQRLQELFLRCYFISCRGSFKNLCGILEESNACGLGKIFDCACEANISVCDRKHSSSENSMRYHEESSLRDELMGYLKKVHYEYLHPNSNFINRLRNSVRNIREKYVELLAEIESFGKRHTYDEIVLPFGSAQPEELSKDYLRKYQKDYAEKQIRMIYSSDKTEQEMLALLDWSYHIIRNIPNRTTYMRNLSNLVARAREEELAKIFKEVDSKLLFPVRLVSSGSPKCYVFGNERNSMVAHLKEKYGAYMPFSFCVDEQIGLLKFSEPFDLDVVSGIG